MNQTPISYREQEVLNLIAYEYSTKMIAQELYISEHTVITHRKHLLAKLEVKNTAGLIRRAFEVGLMRVGHVAALILLWILGFSNIAIAQKANDHKEEFIYSIITISESPDGQLDVSVPLTKVVAGHLKRPELPHSVKSKSNQRLAIRLGNNKSTSQEIIVTDPLVVDYEYINDSDQLTHQIIRKHERTMILRTPISNDVTTMTLSVSDSFKSNQIIQTINIRS